MKFFDSVISLKKIILEKRDFIFLFLSLLCLAVFDFLQIESVDIWLAGLIQEVSHNSQRSFFYWYSELVVNSTTFLFFSILLLGIVLFKKYKVNISIFIIKIVSFFRKNHPYIKLLLVVLAAIFLRITASSFGHNFDFESYKIVGKIVSTGGNVYVETTRYNYSPVFSLILGSFYSLSSHFFNSLAVFRLFVVLLLSFCDVAIGLILYKKYNFKLMVLFLLNPLTVLMSGYYNQFDNIAVLFALTGIFLLDQTDKLSKRDIWSIAFLTLSLATKHLLFIFPLWILFKVGFSIRKKILYAFTPVIIFLLSFVPYLKHGWSGVLHNVFLYDSMNNFPLLNKLFLGWLGIDIHKSFILFFVFFMVWLGWVLRRKSFDQIILYYFIGLVCFSSAIASSYLVTPVVSLCVLGKNLKYVYFYVISIFFAFDGSGLHLFNLFLDNQYIALFLSYGYSVAAWILFAVLFVNIIIPSLEESAADKSLL